MERMCKACGKWHNLDEPWPCSLRLRRWSAPRKAPNVISDNMEPIMHHGTGRMISSKREFSRETREAGMVEIGTEPIRDRKPIKLDKRERVDSIRKAIYKLRNS
jgi:hypothetical protein